MQLYTAIAEDTYSVHIYLFFYYSILLNHDFCYFCYYIQASHNKYVSKSVRPYIHMDTLFIIWCYNISPSRIGPYTFSEISYLNIGNQEFFKGLGHFVAPNLDPNEI